MVYFKRFYGTSTAGSIGVSCQQPRLTLGCSEGAETIPANQPTRCLLVYDPYSPTYHGRDKLQDTLLLEIRRCATGTAGARAAEPRLMLLELPSLPVVRPVFPLFFMSLRGG